MKVAIVFGAGLLGRGFVGPLLSRDYLLYYIDTDYTKIACLQERNVFPVVYPEQEVLWVGPVAAMHYAKTIVGAPDPDLIVSCTGAKNIEAVGETIKNSGWEAPVLCLENDPQAATKLAGLCGNDVASGIAWATIPDPGVGHSRFHPLFTFGDVTARLWVPKGWNHLPVRWLVSTSGSMFGPPQYVSALQYENAEEIWELKYLLHLSPHALLAYLGLFEGCTFIHEAAERFSEELDTAMQPILKYLQEKYAERHPVSRLWQEEQERFADPRLPDLVTRVARNPGTKIQPGERLDRPRGIAEGFGDNHAEGLWCRSLYLAERQGHI